MKLYTSNNKRIGRYKERIKTLLNAHGNLTLMLVYRCCPTNLLSVSLSKCLPYLKKEREREWECVRKMRLYFFKSSALWHTSSLSLYSSPVPQLSWRRLLPMTWNYRKGCQGIIVLVLTWWVWKLQKVSRPNELPNRSEAKSRTNWEHQQNVKSPTLASPIGRR